MKGVHCSWVDMNKIRQALANGERGNFDGYVTLHGRKSLPALPGVYLAFTDRAPLYAGMSGCLASRWERHELYPLLRLLPRSYLAYRLCEAEFLRPRELLLIRRFRPLWQSRP